MLRLHDRLTRLLGVPLLALCASAGAQTDATTPLDRQTDEAFRSVLQQPQDLALWSRYAQLLVRAGNYEGGIAALERLLLDPDASPNIRVEIAALYFRLGSYAMAESLLRAALDDARLQGQQRGFAQALLAEVARRNQPSQFSGSLVAGIRHQTNPAYRTDRGLVLSGGVPGPLPDSQRPEADDDFSVGLRVNHLWDLEAQNSAAIVSSFGAYLVDYRSSSGGQLVASPTKPYDLQLLDFNTGLQFKPAPEGMGNFTLRPHVLLSNVVAQRHQYLRSQGLGLDATWRFDERTVLEVTLDGQDRSFANRIDVVDAANLDGRLYGLRARFSREVAAGQVLVGEYGMRINHAGRDFYEYDSHEGRVTYAFSYASPVANGGYWTTSAWLGALRRSYGGPDPAVSANQTREDREWRVGVSHTVPVAPSWSLLLIAEHSRNAANLPNFRYKNTTVSAAVARSF